MSALTMKRGDTPVWRFTVVDADGAAVNLTGYSARFTVKRNVNHDDTDAFLTKTIGSGITVTNAAGGLLEVRLAAADTEDLVRDTTLVWDLQIAAGANVYTVDSGTLAVALDVSITVP
jgi:hypothetical protein